MDDYDLVPYRTIAVDEAQIPIGTVLYIPSARGCLLTLPDGKRVRHDGYFFAGDDGYGVHGNHIDVFIGISSDCPFPWVVSRPLGHLPRLRRHRPGHHQRIAPPAPCAVRSPPAPNSGGA